MRLGATCSKCLQSVALFLSHSPNGDGDGMGIGKNSFFKERNGAKDKKGYNKCSLG